MICVNHTQFYGVTVWDTNGNVLSPAWQKSLSQFLSLIAMQLHLAVGLGSVYLCY
ncbi:hypothetical protein BCh11DRAFT_03620 [Burkholderia sp. Ch1-1]|nr:hypothetical protein BCh11DRAFT_03620 [Burkholderia sp. Ch1-1]